MRRKIARFNRIHPADLIFFEKINWKSLPGW